MPMNRTTDAPPPPPPPPPPPAVDVWALASGADINDNVKLHYMIRHPWTWVMERLIARKAPRLQAVQSVAELTSSKVLATMQPPAAASTPATRRRRQKRRSQYASFLKVEVVSKDNDAAGGQPVDNLLLAVHGTSTALDGLEDKDELVRTMQRCKCEELYLSPPSKLINWDVTHDECLNLVGQDLPVLLPRNGADEKNSNSKRTSSDDVVAVLKEPMGSQGKGIYFVQTAEEIHKVIDDHHHRALEENGFLDNLIEQKGRIPSWVLQAEVTPCLLIRGGRKFHVRTYIAVVERLHDPNVLFESYIYHQHEVRIAGIPVDPNDQGRDRRAHITNGALSDTTERVLIQDVRELEERNIGGKVEVFVAETFGKYFEPELARRVSMGAREDDGLIQKFAVAGLDLMVTESNEIYLLEVNVNPAAPPQHTVDEAFTVHLESFVQDLVNLAVGQPSPNFVPVYQFLEERGLLA